MFSWSGCPFCKKAKALLDSEGAKYTALELDQMPDGKAIRAELAKLTDRTSVPNIWIAGRQGEGHWCATMCWWRDEVATRDSCAAWRVCVLNVHEAAACRLCAGQNVGGCSDGPGVATLQSKGQLAPMLQAAGAL